MIYTGYYALINKYEKDGLTCIGISGRAPSFFKGLMYSDFAPRWEMFKRWKEGKITNEGYIKEYLEYLNTLNKEKIKEDFNNLDNIILLCYEKEGFCHRHILARWLKENFEYNVGEYKYD